MVSWTDHALAQLRSIHDYIAQNSAIYAKRVSEAVVKRTQHLDELPYKHRKIPELDVLAVIHKRQDFRAEDLP